MSKLTREDKIKIYERRKKGETIPSLAKNFDVQESNIKYLVDLIEKHGYDILRKDKNRTYSKDFKLQIINRILINHESIILTVFGGLVGMGVGVLFGFLAGAVMGIKPIFSLTSIIVSLSISIIVGVIFGVSPARRAAKLNPIDALRTE